MDSNRYRSLAAAGLVALLLVAAGTGCRPAASPQQVVETAVEEAQAGHLPGFLNQFDRESRIRLGMFWSLSTHYGYLRGYSLQHISTLQVTATREEAERAEVDVTDGDRKGTLMLTREDGEWKINLLANDGG